MMMLFTTLLNIWRLVLIFHFQINCCVSFEIHPWSISMSLDNVRIHTPFDRPCFNLWCRANLSSFSATITKSSSRFVFLAWLSWWTHYQFTTILVNASCHVMIVFHCLKSLIQVPFNSKNKFSVTVATFVDVSTKQRRRILMMKGNATNEFLSLFSLAFFRPLLSCLSHFLSLSLWGSLYPHGSIRGRFLGHLFLIAMQHRTNFPWPRIILCVEFRIRFH